jgi:hypothetical protein
MELIQPAKNVFHPVRHAHQKPFHPVSPAHPLNLEALNLVNVSAWMVILKIQI